MIMQTSELFLQLPSSIKISDPVPETPMQAQAMIQPPPGLIIMCVIDHKQMRFFFKFRPFNNFGRD